MRYTYADMPDKTLEGVKKEVADGMVKAVFFTETTMGFPHEIAKEMLEEMTFLEQVAWYFSFRDRHPKVFK